MKVVKKWSLELGQRNRDDLIEFEQVKERQHD